MEAISALQDRGLRVPQDIAVVGFDDITLARYFRPTLTTVRQAISNGGEALVDALLAIVSGQKPRPQVLPTELIVRESSGGQPG
jgi:DNA-binding LacI/PurR family transcriptional regulator